MDRCIWSSKKEYESRLDFIFSSWTPILKLKVIDFVIRNYLVGWMKIVLSFVNEFQPPQNLWSVYIRVQDQITSCAWTPYLVNLLSHKYYKFFFFGRWGLERERILCHVSATSSKSWWSLCVVCFFVSLVYIRNCLIHSQLVDFDGLVILARWKWDSKCPKTFMYFGNLNQHMHDISTFTQKRKIFTTRHARL